MLLKILIAIILLCCPPYGWLILFLWFCIATARSDKKGKAESGNASATVPPAPATPPQEPTPMAVKIEQGSCSIYNISTGAYIRRIGSDAVQASISGDYVAVVDRSGNVTVYRASTGAYIRRLGGDVVSAQIQGDEVALTDKNGRITIYRVSNGAYIRSI